MDKNQSPPNQPATPQPSPIADDNNSNYSPLAAPTKERAYTGAHVNADEVVDRVGEPSFLAPTAPVEGNEEVNKEPARPFNPDYSELPTKEKNQNADTMADAILDGYEFVISKAGTLAKISQKKLNKEIIEGTISPNLGFPIGSGEVISVTEFVKEFNDSADSAFVVEPEFKEKVKPVLQRVLAKKGAGMTDEHMLMYMFGKDIMIRGAMVFSLRAESRNLMAQMRDHTQALAPAPQVLSASPTQDSPIVSPIKENPAPLKEAEVPMAVVKDAELPGFNHKNDIPDNIRKFGDSAILDHMNEKFPLDKGKVSTGKAPGSPTGPRSINRGKK